MHVSKATLAYSYETSTNVLFSFSKWKAYLKNNHCIFRPLDNFTSFHMGASTVGLVVDNQDSHLFNPYPHFGQPTLWPRGFPLANINGQETGRNYRYHTMTKLTTYLLYIHHHHHHHHYHHQQHHHHVHHHSRHHIVDIIILLIIMIIIIIIVNVTALLIIVYPSFILELILFLD